jgi:hypothetical protein
MDDCNMLYYYTIYVNVTLGCSTQYGFTLCFVIYYIIQCVPVICSKSSDTGTNTDNNHNHVPAFINPEQLSLAYDDSELELLFDAQEK